ncbi:unnamed protein product [Somion occarium]|uniref:Uncharacterized protein n=1 Tax=Somion occarium TaxID=3059160 RepID=A0ABP1DHW6_9APHY
MDQGPRAVATTPGTIHGCQMGAKCRHDLTAQGKTVRDAFYSQYRFTAHSEVPVGEIDKVVEQIQTYTGCEFYTRKHFTKWMQAKKKRENGLQNIQTLVNVCSASASPRPNIDDIDTTESEYDSPEENSKEVNAQTVQDSLDLPFSPISHCNFGERLHYTQMPAHSTEEAEFPSFRLRPVHTW